MKEGTLFAVMCICGVILVVQPWMVFRTYGDNFTDGGNLSEHGIRRFLGKPDGPSES